MCVVVEMPLIRASCSESYPPSLQFHTINSTNMAAVQTSEVGAAVMTPENRAQKVLKL
jgi:hypothetical protein